MRNKNRISRRGHKVTKAVVNGVVDYTKTVSVSRGGVKHEHFKPVLINKVKVASGGNHQSRRADKAYEKSLHSRLKKTKANNHKKLLAEQRKTKLNNRIKKAYEKRNTK